MFTPFVASAPGKVILSGEHSVVHGTCAIATVVDRRTFVNFSTEAPSAKHNENIPQMASQIPQANISLAISYDTYVLIHQWRLDDIISHKQILYQKAMDTIEDYDNKGHNYFTTQDKLLNYIQEHTHPSKHLQCKHHYTLDTLVDIFDQTYDQIPVVVYRYNTKSEDKSFVKAIQVDYSKLSPNIEVCPAKVFIMYYLFVLLSSSTMTSTTQYPTLHAYLKSDIPMGSGLGSSASVCSSLATGFYHILRHIECHDDASTPPLTIAISQRKVINHWAFQGERIIHGTPSGVDNSCVVYGGVVTFRKIGQETELNFLPSGCIPPSIQIIITNTKQPKDTKALVAGVRGLKAKYPMIIEPLFHSIEQITQTVVSHIQKYLLTMKRQQQSDDREDADDYLNHNPGDNVTDVDVYNMFHDVLFINQHILNAIGVGHLKIDEVLNIARKYDDALITKLTGAGGGGCVISLTKPGLDEAIIDQFTKDCEEANFEVLVTSMGQNGVMLHEIE